MRIRPYRFPASISGEVVLVRASGKGPYIFRRDGSHFLPVLQNAQFSESDESIFGYSLRISKVNTLVGNSPR